MRKLLHFSTILLLYFGLLLYIGSNGWVWLETVFGITNLYLYWAVLFVLGYSYIVARFAKLPLLKIVGAFWFGLFQYSVLILPVANIVYLILVLAGIPAELVITWTGAAVLTLLLLIMTIGTVQAYSPVVRKYEITVPKKANGLKHLRIAVASDIHFGKLSGKRHFKRLISTVNEIKPDVVFLPGDIVDDDPRPFISKKIGPLMKTMHAPYGIYGVLGNHEYYGGKIPLLLDEMKKHGVKMLLDDVRLINNAIYIIGRKDKTDRHRASIEKLMEHVDPTRPIIVLDHQPYELEDAMINGVDVSISGHTHRGQMWPNHLITKRIYELDWGYKKKQQLHAFVSSGFGFWGPPLRLGSRSEILQIDITFGV